MRYELVVWGQSGTRLHSRYVASLTEGKVLARRVFRRFPTALRVSVYFDGAGGVCVWEQPIEPAEPLPCIMRDLN